MTSSRPVGALLVGSLAFESAEQVFDHVANILGDHVRAIPDGETGERSGWILFQNEVFARNAAFDRKPRDEGGTYGLGPYGGFRLVDGADPDDVDLGSLGYLEAAVASYAEFRRLRDAGAIHDDVRFQVSLPTPLAPVALFTVRESSPMVLAIYERALLAELRAIQEQIPPEDLAVQLDLANEIGMWERAAGHFDGEPGDAFDPWFGDVVETTALMAARAADAVGDPVLFGLHLCYGSYQGAHFLQPQNLAILTQGANALRAAIGRRIDWLHMPVPQDRDDAAFFSPLRNLGLAPETMFYLGLLHAGDGVEGAERRIAAAMQFIEHFGVATECGMGQVSPDAMPALLALHAQVAQPLPWRA